MVKRTAGIMQTRVIVPAPTSLRKAMWLSLAPPACATSSGTSAEESDIAECIPDAAFELKPTRSAAPEGRPSLHADPTGPRDVRDVGEVAGVERHEREVEVDAHPEAL